MAKVADATVEQCVLALALMEKVSCGYQSNLCTCLDGDCPCHSLGFQEVHGKVPEFPMLRGVCGCISKEQGACSECWAEKTRVGSQKAHSASCSGNGCQGRGWLPVTTTDALLEAGKPWELGVCWSLENQQYEGSCRDKLYPRYADEPCLALSLALCAVKGIEEVG